MIKKIFVILFFSILTLYFIYFIRFNLWISQGTRLIKNSISPALSNKEKSLEEILKIKNFPTLLNKYLKKVLPSRISPYTYVYIKQKGLFFLAPQQKGFSFTAEQHSSLTQSSFSWQALLKVFNLPFIKVCDRLLIDPKLDLKRSNALYLKADLRAKLLGAISVASASGSDLIQGELIRYLAELAWTPLAILHLDSITWTQIDSKTLRASLDYQEQKVKLDFIFNSENLIEKVFVKERKMQTPNGFETRPWEGCFSEYQHYDGLLLPSKGEVSWLLPEGKFTYFKGRLETYKPHHSPLL